MAFSRLYAILAYAIPHIAGSAAPHTIQPRHTNKLETNTGFDDTTSAGAQAVSRLLPAFRADLHRRHVGCRSLRDMPGPLPVHLLANHRRQPFAHHHLHPIRHPQQPTLAR